MAYCRCNKSRCNNLSPTPSIGSSPFQCPIGSCITNPDGSCGLYPDGYHCRLPSSYRDSQGITHPIQYVYGSNNPYVYMVSVPNSQDYLDPNVGQQICGSLQAVPVSNPDGSNRQIWCGILKGNTYVPIYPISSYQMPVQYVSVPSS